MFLKRFYKHKSTVVIRVIANGLVITQNTNIHHFPVLQYISTYCTELMIAQCSKTEHCHSWVTLIWWHFMTVYSDSSMMMMTVAKLGTCVNNKLVLDSPH